MAPPTSPFLRLPLELREAIYSYVLPHTSPYQSDPRLRISPAHNLRTTQESHPPGQRRLDTDAIWHLGSTALLCTCRQVHDECAALLYGTNVFVLDVSLDAIRFRLRWLTASNLAPGRSLPFLDHFSARNLLLVRRYVIHVELVDDYTGMIKFNTSGRGLAAGIRARVQDLAETMAAADALEAVRVNLSGGMAGNVGYLTGRGGRYCEMAELVLEPFGGVRGVRHVKVTGTSEEYAEGLERSMGMGRV